MNHQDIKSWLRSYKGDGCLVCPGCGRWEYIEFDRPRKMTRDVWCEKCGTKWREVLDVRKLVLEADDGQHEYILIGGEDE